MRLTLGLAIAAALALPLQADPAADYARLMAAVPGLSLWAEPGPTLQAQIDMLPGLEGRWVELGTLMRGTPDFPGADQIASQCDRSPFVLSVTGPASLRLTRRYGADDEISYDLAYAGGTTYVGQFTQREMIATLFNDTPVEEIDPGMLYPVLTNNPWLGYVSLLPVGSDLILVQPLVRTPNLLVRCP